VECLHNQCPTGKEWSGLLVYQIVKGGIEDLDILEINCEQVYPMDFGDATFTSFDGDEEWIKFFEQFPEIDPIKKQPGSNWHIGKIHSHHTMGAFHSQTDTQDLYDSAPNYPFFLSLVVNYACQPFAELAVQAEVKEKKVEKQSWKLLKGWNLGNSEIKKTEETKKATFVVPCDVNYLQEPWLVEKLKQLKDKAKPKVWVNSANTTIIKSSTEVDPKVRNRMLACLPDLLFLGAKNTANTPYMALTEVGTRLDIDKTLKYKKALKYHFCEEWFDQNFYNIDCTEEDVITAISVFINFHRNLWIHTTLQDALNELKTEHTKLRTFQNSTVV
jgi:hypothetical protein